MLEIFNNLNIPTEIQSIVLDRKEIINLPLVKFELPSIDKKVKKKKNVQQRVILDERKKMRVIECWKGKRRRRKGRGQFKCIRV